MKEYKIKTDNIENKQDFYANLIKTIPVNPISMSVRIAPESQEWSTYFHGLEDDNPIFKHDFKVRFNYDKNKDLFVPEIANYDKSNVNEDANFILENFFTYKPFIIEYHSKTGEKKAFPRFRDKILNNALNVGYHINNANFGFNYENNNFIATSLTIDANFNRAATLALNNNSILNINNEKRNKILIEWFENLKSDLEKELE